MTQANQPNHPQSTDAPQDTPTQDSVLAETLEAFDPSSETSVIEGDIDLATFEARLAELQQEVKSAKEGQARANAEMYNTQKRMEQESEKSRKYALQKFAKELLEVVDNLERAIDSASHSNDDTSQAILEGVQLTHKSLMGVLNKNGIEVVDPQGEAFDADKHEAVGIDPTAEADTVGEVLQKGYLLNDRLLRPAMVRVGQ